MQINRKKTVDEMIKRFNKNQKSNKNSAVSKKNHRSIFIDFYFKNFRKNNQQN